MSVGAPRRLNYVEHGRAVVVLAMAQDLVRAGRRARALLDENRPVTFVVGCNRCGVDAVELLDELRLQARRTDAQLTIVVADEGFRRLVTLVGLADLIDE